MCGQTFKYFFLKTNQVNFKAKRLKVNCQLHHQASKKAKQNKICKMASSHTSLRFKTQKGAVLIRILTQAHVSLTNKVKTVHEKQYKNEVSQWQLTKIKMIMK